MKTRRILLLPVFVLGSLTGSELTQKSVEFVPEQRKLSHEVRDTDKSYDQPLVEVQEYCDRQADCNRDYCKKAHAHLLSLSCTEEEVPPQDTAIGQTNKYPALEGRANAPENYIELYCTEFDTKRLLSRRMANLER